MYSHSTINKLIYLLVWLPVIAACTNSSINKSIATPDSTGLPEMVNNSPIGTSEDLINITPESATTPLPTPIMRFYSEPSSCDSSVVPGHILFSQVSTSDPLVSDLYIMDGNACTKHLLMRNISGASAWSIDGKRISVGCENNNYICILDAPASLDTCLKTNNAFDDCMPVILEKYAVPRRSKEILSTSWSYDGAQISVESSSSETQYYVDILTLTGGGNWQTIIEGKIVHAEMSPVRNEMLFDGIYIMPLDGKSINIFFQGSHGIWAHDGTKIAYQLSNNIAQWDFNHTPHLTILFETQGTWVFKPEASDKRNWLPHNIGLSTGSRNMSWSTDGRYLAFVASRADYDSQVFRLDTNTGELVILTEKFENKDGGYYPPTNYFAPAWGP